MEECGCNVEECGCDVEQCRCNVDIMWSNVDVMWSNVDVMWTLHISTFQKFTKSSLLLGHYLEIGKCGPATSPH